MRSADSLSATSLRAPETSGAIAPPSTMIPSGAPAAASQAGNRCSSGMMRRLPIGESPRIASTTMLPAARRRPARAKRVGNSSRPRIAIEMTRLDGIAKKPRILEAMKNMTSLRRPAHGFFRIHNIVSIADALGVHALACPEAPDSLKAGHPTP